MGGLSGRGDEFRSYDQSPFGLAAETSPGYGSHGRPCRASRTARNWRSGYADIMDFAKLMLASVTIGHSNVSSGFWRQQAFVFRMNDDGDDTNTVPLK
jgi:hypothetical protein